MLRRIVTLVIACASIGAWADEPAADPAGLPAYRARFDRARPLIAVVGLNAGTEVTDFVVPYGILTHAGVADVMALATGPGPIKMRPALVIEPHATIEQFDQRFAQGADYVIVPAVAMGRHNDPVLLGWLQDQAAKGATIVCVCVCDGGAGRVHRRAATC